LDLRDQICNQLSFSISRIAFPRIFVAVGGRFNKDVMGGNSLLIGCAITQGSGTGLRLSAAMSGHLFPARNFTVSAGAVLLLDG